MSGTTQYYVEFETSLQNATYDIKWGKPDLAASLLCDDSGTGAGWPALPTCVNTSFGGYAGNWTMTTKLHPGPTVGLRDTTPALMNATLTAPSRGATAWRVTLRPATLYIRPATLYTQAAALRIQAAALCAQAAVLCTQAAALCAQAAAMCAQASRRRGHGPLVSHCVDTQHLRTLLLPARDLDRGDPLPDPRHAGIRDGRRWLPHVSRRVARR